MDGVPLRTPASLQKVKEDMTVTVPDYLKILQETEYEFSLENWVLTGLQSGFSSQPPRPEPCPRSSGVPSSCPPYWMMFSSPQQSRLASRHSSDFWEPKPRQRSHSLNSTVLGSNLAASDEGEGSTQRAGKKCVSGKTGLEKKDPAQPGRRKAQKAFVPDLLNPPSCLSSLPHQRRKNLRHRSLSVRHATSTQQDADPEHHSQTSTSQRNSTGSRAPVSGRIPTISNQTAHQTCDRADTAEDSPAPPTLWKRHSALDSSAELLSALSPEERELLGAITAQGYNLHTAIIALQRTGTQTPEKILSYLVACDHLCQLGYDMAQVEEALEMFENCETKAKQFLQLLNQFNEMGFQQNAIKEVLLVHENHPERALEELMMRVA